MSAETGHAANRVYSDQSGNLHLNGAKLYDAGENDMTGGGANGASLAALTLAGFLRLLRTAPITAAGSALANAAPLFTGFQTVTGADNTKCVVLPVPVGGEIVIVANNSATKTLPVFPNSGAAIDGGSANAAVTQSAQKTAVYVADSATAWFSIQST